LLSDLAHLRLQSSLPVPTPVYLSCQLQDADGNVLVTLVSSRFECGEGQIDLSGSRSAVHWSYDYTRHPVCDTIRKTGFLPQGRYLFLCIVKGISDPSVELGRNSLDFSVTSDIAYRNQYSTRNPANSKEKKKGNVQFNGYSELTG
jgi:hypothetical protein